jgi:hypothetical protein
MIINLSERARSGSYKEPNEFAMVKWGDSPIKLYLSDDLVPKIESIFPPLHFPTLPIRALPPLKFGGKLACTRKNCYNKHICLPEYCPDFYWEDEIDEGSMSILQRMG